MVAPRDRDSIVVVRCIRCKKLEKLSVNSSDLEDFKAGKGYVQSLFPYLNPAERDVLVTRFCLNCQKELGV